MCQVLKVGSSGYYHWLDRPISPRSCQNIKLLKVVKLICQQSRGRYGSPRITETLNKLGIKVSCPLCGKAEEKRGNPEYNKKETSYYYRFGTQVCARRKPHQQKFHTGPLGQK